MSRTFYIKCNKCGKEEKVSPTERMGHTQIPTGWKAKWGEANDKHWCPKCIKNHKYIITYVVYKNAIGGLCLRDFVNNSMGANMFIEKIGAENCVDVFYKEYFI